MIYLDNAATTIHKPPKVITAVTQAMNSIGNAGRGAHDVALNASRIVFDTREKLRDFFNAAAAKEIVFTMNATESLNIAIKGVLGSGDHVITTMLEHNSVLRPLYEMETKGVTLSIVKSNAQGNISYDEVAQAILPNTKAIICNVASNVTGNRIDLKKMGEIAKAHNALFIVDASQLAGIYPIDVQALNIDILCFTGHKSLLGPQGIGGMYVRNGIDVKPLLSGGSGTYTYSKTHPQQMPTRLEAGTLNGHGIAGLYAAIEYIQEQGLDNICQKAMYLALEFYDGIRNIPNVKIYGDFKDKNRCPIVTLNIGDYDSAKVSDELLITYGISTRPGAHCAPLMHKALGTVEQGAVRFSFSHLNTKEEVQIAIDAVQKIAGEA